MLDELKGSRKVIGINQTLRALNEGRAQKVLIASDAEERLTRPIVSLCQSKGVPCQTVASMRELGAACQIDVGASAVAILREQ